MAKRGRPKKAVLGTREDRLKYYRAYYRKHKAASPDFGNKDSLLVRIIQCLPMTNEEVNRWNPAMRAKLHRSIYMWLSGSERIPEEYLKTNYDMAQYMSHITGEGEFIICAGYRHKCAKRCTWRGLIRFKAVARIDYGYRVTLVKVWQNRLRHYWFRKYKPAFF